MTPPTTHGLSQLLTDSLGRCVEVTAVPGPAITKAGEGTVTAVYRADDQSVASVCVCDLACVIYVGAALGVYLYQVAKEDLDAKRLDTNIVDNFSEILNICAGWVSAVTRRHVKFGALHLEEAQQPAEVRTLCKAKGHCLHLQLSIAGYGSGRMTLLR